MNLVKGAGECSLISPIEQVEGNRDNLPQRLEQLTLSTCNSRKTAKIVLKRVVELQEGMGTVSEKYGRESYTC